MLEKYLGLYSSSTPGTASAVPGAVALGDRKGPSEARAGPRQRARAVGEADQIFSPSATADGLKICHAPLCPFRLEDK